MESHAGSLRRWIHDSRPARSRRETRAHQHAGIRRQSHPKTRIVAGLVFAVSAFAQDTDPRATLVRAFFEDKTFPNKTAVYTGEMLHYADGQSYGETAPEGCTYAYRTLIEQPEHAVVAATIHNGEEFLGDWYCFLRNVDGLWKIEALRTMTLPINFYERIEELSAKENPGPAERAALRNLQLATGSDRERRAHWQNHRSEFEGVVAAFQETGLELLWSDTKGYEEPLKSLQKRLSNIGVNAIFKRESCANCIYLYIGGVSTDEAGYIYTPDAASPPEMSPRTYILVEPIAEGWYLYKTT